MSKLFTPVKLGSAELGHRIAMAPLTRYRADDDRVPLPIVKGELRAVTLDVGSQVRS